MLWWRTLQQNAKGCHYKTSMTTKEQRQRSIEEKNTLKAPGRKEVPNQMFHEMNMKNTALQNIWLGKGFLKEKKTLSCYYSPVSDLYRKYRMAETELI